MSKQNNIKNFFQKFIRSLCPKFQGLKSSTIDLFNSNLSGVIGYFKFCKPNLTSPFSPNHYSGPQYSPAGIGINHGPYRESPPIPPTIHYGQYEGYSVSIYIFNRRFHQFPLSIKCDIKSSYKYNCDFILIIFQHLYLKLVARYVEEVNTNSENIKSSVIQSFFQGGNKYGSNGIAFRDHDVNPQDLAYQGWEYRNKNGGEEIKAEEP